MRTPPLKAALRIKGNFKFLQDTGPGKGWIKQNQAFYDKLVGVASSSGGDSLVFGWAMAEATFWPIIPDFLLAPLAIGDQRKAYQPLLASSLGSALGTLLLFWVARRYPEQSQDLLKRFPLVHDYYFEQVEQKLKKNWFLALLLQPWSGIPSKVWAVGGAPLIPWLALPVLMCARTLRMAIAAFISLLFARLMQRYLRNFSLQIAFLYVVFFFYSWWQVVKKHPPASL